MALREWLALTRAEHGAIVLVAVIAAQAVAAGGFSFNQLFPALGPVLITWGAFAWNDFFGLKSDKALGRKERPLVSGKIRPKQALAAALLLFGAGLALAHAVNSACFVISFVYVLFAMAYDAFLKKKPLLGNAFIASSMSVSFVYGNFAVSQSLNYYVVVFALTAFFAGLGRELIITLRDVEGDKKIGAVTLPMLLGPKNTAIAASALVYLGVGASLAPLMTELRPAYVALIVAADALFILTTYKVLLSQERKALSEARNLTLYALGVGVLAFASLAF